MFEVAGASVTVARRGGESIDILRDITLTLEPGHIYAIAGASGSGKTTLIHLLAGIVVPTTGTVAYGGLSIDDLNEGARDRWRRHNCGLIFQDFRLLDELGPVSNVLLPIWYGVTPRRSRTQAEAALTDLGVPLRQGPVGLLSRGEQQRVALARALIGDPTIILADEPTASLDEANADYLVERLATLAAAGKSVVCATHDRRVIDRADRVIELSAGRMQGAAS